MDQGFKVIVVERQIDENNRKAINQRVEIISYVDALNGSFLMLIQVFSILVKKGQDNKIINLHDKTVIYTSRFVYLHQDSCSSDIKKSMTAGSIIVFSNGDQKMKAN